MPVPQISLPTYLDQVRLFSPDARHPSHPSRKGRPLPRSLRLDHVASPAVCPHWGCRFRPDPGPFAILTPLSSLQRLKVLLAARILRPSLIPDHVDCRADWLATLLGCSSKALGVLFTVEAGALIQSRQRTPSAGPVDAPRVRHIRDWELSYPYSDPLHLACPICGRDATVAQACAQAYPPAAGPSPDRMLRLLRQLPVQLGAFMPVAWFAQGVGVSAHEAARIMRQAGFELTRGYSATLGRQCLGVPDRLCPWEMPS